MSGGMAGPDLEMKMKENTPETNSAYDVGQLFYVGKQKTDLAPI